MEKMDLSKLSKEELLIKCDELQIVKCKSKNKSVKIWIFQFEYPYFYLFFKKN